MAGTFIIIEAGSKTEIGQIGEADSEAYFADVNHSLNRISAEEISDVGIEEILGTIRDLTVDVGQGICSFQEMLG